MLVKNFLSLLVIALTGFFLLSSDAFAQETIKMKPMTPDKLQIDPGVISKLKPDLVVTEFRLTGRPTVNQQKSVEVPIRVVIRNQGQTPAKIFKTAVEYKDPKSQNTYVVAFNVPGQSDSWYPLTKGPLPPNAEVAFSGKVTFHPSVRGVTVDLRAMADSCSGDEFMPKHCRVDETNEGNNYSKPIAVKLP